MKPLAIDLFTGLHGWGCGLVAEGYRVVGFDLEDMCAQFGQSRPDDIQLVIQDVLTLHGSQFKDATLIVASPPCQKYSWMAMPWKRAKAAAAAIRADETGQALADLTRLFDACFRIQKEASLAAGRHIPLVVENVRGAIPWVGRSRYNFGSFHLWGDVPALMPIATRAQKFNPDGTNHGQGSWFAIADSKSRGSKNNGSSWFNIAHNTASGKGQNPDGRKVPSENGRRTDVGKGARFTSRDCGVEGGTKVGGDWFSDLQSPRQYGSKSSARKMASAMIAKIPLPLSRHIAATYKP